MLAILLALLLAQSPARTFSGDERPTYIVANYWYLMHAPVEQLMCYRNGLRQVQPDDFTIKGPLISSATWTASDTLVCTYMY